MANRQSSVWRDGLTGFYTPEAFDGILKLEVARASRYRRPFSLYSLEFNLPEGRKKAAYYELFPQIAPFMTAGLRRCDQVARLRGNSVAILLPETRTDGALCVAERLRSKVGETRFVTEDESVEVTLNLGLACYPRHGMDPATLTWAANRAMLLARGEGGDRVELYPDALHPDYC